MPIFYNAVGSSTVTGGTGQDRFFAFTKDDNFDNVRPDVIAPTFWWETGIRTASGGFLAYSAINLQLSLDLLLGGAGNDVVYGSNLNDGLFYNNGVISGGVGSFDAIEQFFMGAGDDIVDLSGHGTGGIDYAKDADIHGEAGNDFIVGGAGKDLIWGDGGNDTLFGYRGADTLYGGDGDDLLYGDDLGFNNIAGDDVVYGQGGNDTLYGGGRTDRLDGGDGNDVLNGGLGGDSLVGGAGDDILNGDDAGTAGNDILDGGSGNDQLFGGGGNDEMTASSGDDLLDGGIGTDYLLGGIGADTLVASAGNDQLDGGADVDTAVFSGNRADYGFTLNADGSYTATDLRAGQPDGVDTVRNTEFFRFADGTFASAGLNYPPTITSNGGGASAAVSIAENGLAVTTVAATDPDAGQTVSFAIAGGADAAFFTIDSATGALSFVSAPDFENPADQGGNNVYDVIVRALDGAGGVDDQSLAVTVTDVADGRAPVIASNGGGATASLNVAENSAGVTTVTASDPDGTTPTYAIIGGSDSALFRIDAVTGALSFITAPDYETPLDANHDNVYTVLVSASDGVNRDQQTISVTVTNLNDNAPVITSGGGAATLDLALDENIALAATIVATDADGTAPTYAIEGGADAARFTIDPATGQLRFLAAPNFEAPTDANGDNVYEIQVSAGDGLSKDLQTLRITVRNVNDAAPVITSNGGGASAAIAIAENGAAVTTVTSTDADGPTAVYSIAGGDDAALFTIDAATGVLRFVNAPDYEDPADLGGNNVYDVIVRSSDGLFSTVQALAIQVTDVNEVGVTITGSSGNNTVSPTATNTAYRTTALNDTVYGLAGNDTIDGGGGLDRMEGGVGNDIYYVDRFVDDAKTINDDLVVEAAGAGLDLVNSTVTYRLANEVENLTLIGGVAIAGYGNGVNNIIAGNAAANALFGLDGNDFVSGDAGADTLWGGNGNDELTGGADNDTLNGEAGADKLDGGTGTDTMTGGIGDDVYVVDAYSDDGNAANDDLVVEAAGGGLDTVQASVGYVLAAEADNLVLTGASALDGTGNALANTMTGNAAANTLSGLDGFDTLNGGSGNDQLFGGNGNDTLNGGDGDDRLVGDADNDLLDGGNGNDAIEGGIGADTLRGKAGIDTLNGGIGKDILTGGTESDTFFFGNQDSTLQTATYDTITDFLSVDDGIDLFAVAGPLASSLYGEATIASTSFTDALASATGLLSSGRQVAFVAGTTDGWLFWDVNGDLAVDQSVLLQGANSLSALDYIDIA